MSGAPVDPDGPLGRTLVAAAGLMAAAADPWWIVGSAAVALHGRDPGTVGDVDLLAGARDAAAVLERAAIPVRPGDPHPRFRSTVFARLTATPLPIELMAGFAVAGPGGWSPVSFGSRIGVAVGGAELFVPSTVELASLLRRLGRGKDRVRAATLDRASRG